MAKALLAPRMGQLRESPTAAISDLMRTMADKGEKVINFGEGELDFDTPHHIAEAGVAAIRAGETRYTAVAGTVGLRQAIADKFRRENGLSYTPDQIIVGTGAKQVLFNALVATVGPGDEVIIPAPYWVSYPDMVRVAEGTPVTVAADETSGFKLTPEALSSAITDKTRCLILNSPNNPSGAVYGPEDMRRLLAVVADRPDILVIADDIYEHLIYDGVFATPAAVFPEIADRVLTINGVSKAYAMTGWRIGYAGGPPWLIDAMRVLQSQSTSNAATMCQEAARIALCGPQDVLPGRIAELRKRRDLVVERINACEGLSTGTPSGAFYVFASCRGLIDRTTPDGDVLKTDTDVAGYLVREAKVGLVPGSAFGMSPYLRIAYASGKDILEDGCARIRRACGLTRP